MEEELLLHFGKDCNRLGLDVLQILEACRFVGMRIPNVLNAFVYATFSVYLKICLLLHNLVLL